MTRLLTESQWDEIKTGVQELKDRINELERTIDAVKRLYIEGIENKEDIELLEKYGRI